MVSKEAERLTADSDNLTADFEDAVSVTVNSVSVIHKGKQSGNVEDLQENTYDKNEVDNSIEEKVSETIVQTGSNFF